MFDLLVFFRYNPANPRERCEYPRASRGGIAVTRIRRDLFFGFAIALLLTGARFKIDATLKNHLRRNYMKYLTLWQIYP